MNILANDGLIQEAVEALEAQGHEVYTDGITAENLANWINQNNIECLFVRSATKVNSELIANCPNLKYIGRAGVGVDNIDLEAAKAHNKVVFNTPTASSRSVAELVMGFIYSYSRNIAYSNMQLSTDNFKSLKKELEDFNTEVQGKTLGVIGYGNIGQSVVKLAQANGMRVLIYDPYIIEELDHITVTKDKLLAESDYVTIHISGSTEVLNIEDFIKMKRDAVVINTSRGGCVNEEDLIEAIYQEMIMGACLDTFVGEPNPKAELINNPWILVTPHIGGATKEAQIKIGIELVKKLAEYTETITV
jgi:D-3-phosphoglycerate dehydrogenase